MLVRTRTSRQTAYSARKTRLREIGIVIIYDDVILASMIEVLIGGILVVVAAVIHILEGLHLLEWIEKHSPKAHRLLIRKDVAAALTLVGIGLLALQIKEHWENKGAAGPCSSASSGPVSGNGNIASSGNCNEINSRPNGPGAGQK